MAKVFLGVGHGGSDPGAVANGFKEKDLNLSIAAVCHNELVRHGVSVLMSRYKDEEDTLNEEIKECNAFKPDLAIDIHNNAGGGDGVEVFYHYKGGASKTLADNVLSEIVKIGQNSRGAKTKTGSDGRDYYGFIRETTAPAVIVECAFVDNAKDMQIIDTEAERKVMGVAIAKGILETLGIAYVEEKKESEIVENIDYKISISDLKAKGYKNIIIEL
jgi:N-acetylmuramoyl-L-alanine amidase